MVSDSYRQVGEIAGSTEEIYNRRTHNIFYVEDAVEEPVAYHSVQLRRSGPSSIVLLIFILKLL